ncbi:hypothetical protein [Roseivivax sp. CAU 1761]
MKVMLTGFVAALVLSGVAYLVLDALDYTAAERVVSDSVRLGDAGPEDENLIDLPE